MKELKELYFEDLEVGQAFTTPVLTISAPEVDVFSILTGQANILNNKDNLHMDRKYARKLQLKDRVVPGLQLLAYTTKMGNLWDANIVLYLGIDKVKFLSPAYPGDRLKLQMEVLVKKEIEKWKDKGLITLGYTMFNQDQAVIMTAESSFQFLKRQ